MTDFRTLCEQLMELAEGKRYDGSAVIAKARAALAQPETVAPTDEELLELMPETMRDEFSYAAKVCSDATGGQVKPGIFRVALNTAVLEYARVVLAHFSEVFAEIER